MEDGNFQDLLQCNIQIEFSKIVFRQCSPDWNMPYSCLDHINLTYVVSGKADYVLDGAHYRVAKGDLICVPYGGTRQASIIPEDLMRCYSIDLTLCDSAGRPLRLPLPYVSRPENPTAITDLLSKMNVDWLQHTQFAQFRTRVLFLLLLTHLLPDGQQSLHATETADNRVLSIMTYIGRHYREPLSLEFFAERLSMNKVYLGMMFKRDAGLTFHQYLLNARLNAAEDLLNTGKYTVSEVSELTGFRDTSYFSRVFQKAFGVRPGAYKTLAKPQEPHP